MAYVYSKKYDYLMFYNAKSGCTTWYNLFFNLHKDEIKTEEIKLSRKKFPKPKTKINLVKKKIMVVRNPFSRIVSLYTNRIINNYQYLRRTLHKSKILKKYQKISFREFVDLLYKLNSKNILNRLDIHLHKQTKYYFKDTNIIKLENFNKEIIKIYTKLNFLDLIPKIKKILKDQNILNQTIKNEDKKFVGDHKFKIGNKNFPIWNYFYDEEIKKKIIEIYKDEFELFNYSIDIN